MVVYPADNPYDYVEIRGTATGTRDDADDHINRLAKKYIDQDEYPFRQPGEERIKYVITPSASATRSRASAKPASGASCGRAALRRRGTS